MTAQHYYRSLKDLKYLGTEISFYDKKKPEKVKETIVQISRRMRDGVVRVTDLETGKQYFIKEVDVRLYEPIVEEV